MGVKALSLTGVASVRSSILPSVRPNIISAAPTERISVKFDIGDLIKICRESPNLAQIKQKYRTFYMKI
jgi:DNA-directed RNA polymerase subunit H (RpoH/RPB5)